jgi:hypothetical protein
MAGMAGVLLRQDFMEAVEALKQVSGGYEQGFVKR